MTPTKEETKTAKEILLKHYGQPDKAAETFNILAAMEEYASQFKPQEPSLPKALKALLIEKYPIMTEWEANKRHSDSTFNYSSYSDEIKQHREIATQFYLAGQASKGSETKWISVEKELPKMEQEVNCTQRDNERVLSAIYNGNFKVQKNVEANDRSIISYWTQITHWQPLPSVPNREE